MVSNLNSTLVEIGVMDRHSKSEGMIGFSWYIVDL